MNNNIWVLFLAPMISSCSSFSSNQEEFILPVQKEITLKCSPDDNAMYLSGFDSRGGSFSENEFVIANQTLSGCIDKEIAPTKLASLKPSPREQRSKALSKENEYVEELKRKIPNLTVSGVCYISYQFEIAAVKQASFELMGEKRDSEIGEYWSTAKAFDVPEEKATQYIDYLKSNRDVLSFKYEATSQRGTQTEFMRYCPVNPKNYVPDAILHKWMTYQK